MTSTRIRTDVYPARVTIAPPLRGQADEPQILDKVRVVVTLDAIYVFKDSAKGPVIAFTERLASYEKGVPAHRQRRGTPQRSPLAVTDSGMNVTFTRTSGCGCGSRLKSFSPFTSINVLASSNDA